MNKQDILDASTQRTKGKDAISSNIQAAKAVAQIVKTTLGPMGMDKMLIDQMGDTIITNDGVKILQEMEIEHPGAKLLVEVAKTQESEVGDGTTTAVIISGELLSQAEKLLEQNIHPNTIVRAYKIASQKALEILENHAVKVDTSSKEMIKDIVETAITGKIAEYSKEEISNLLFEVTNLVKQDNKIPIKNIKIQKAQGGNTKDSFIVKGVVLDKNPANSNMPKKQENPNILLIDFPLEVRELDSSDAKININSLEEYEQFLKSEENYLKELVFRIKQLGVNTLICQKGIDDNVAYYLAKESILATRRTKKSDMEKLSLALQTPIVSTFEDLSQENLSTCGSVEVKEILGEQYVFIQDCKNPKSITLFLKASTKHFLDEIQRAVEDALGDINAVLSSGKIVAGGGAIELEIYKNLQDFAKTFSGKEQLIIESFAQSFLSIPKILCQNSGFDEIETIAKLISMHEQNKTKAGINGFSGIVEDTIKEKIIEPINVKSQVIKSATESSSMILRIDDIIAAKRLAKEESITDF